MAVTTSGYCKITGLSKAMPPSHYVPMMPALSQSEQSQLFGCKITMASHMDHHYVPIIEFAKGKGPGIISCRITGRVAESVARPVPLPEEGLEVKRAHRFKRDLRYMEPFVSRLANPGEKQAMDNLMEIMRQHTEIDTGNYFVYSLNDRRTGKTGIVLPYEYEVAIRTGAIESILLSGDSNSLVVKLRDGPMCTIPMDKVGKLQVERLSEDEMLFDGHGPDREVIEKQRQDKAAREKEDRDQMAEYLADMERKRKEREQRKKNKMKDTMRQKLAEAEEAERRQKATEEEIKRQYAEAAQIRAEAEAAKAAALEAARGRASERDRREAEERLQRAEEAARLAEEKLQREEEERRLAEEKQRAEEAAAAEALAAVDPYDMSVNELLDHMKEKAGGDEALMEDMADAAKIGMSSTQIAEMVTASVIEAIEEEYAEPEEEEEEEEDEEEEEEEEVKAEVVSVPGMTEEERLIEEEQMEALRQEMLEKKRIEREAKRMQRQKKREEQERKDEEKRLAKERRERKKAEMMERMAAVRRADAEEEAERMKKPEMREIKPHEIQRRKQKPEPLDIPVEERTEFLVQTRDGKAVITADELEETSLVEGRISTDEDGEAKLTPGRAIKTKSGMEFIAGKIITTDESREFVPGEEVDLPEGPKFVPGQTIETQFGPQFVAGKTIGEGENIEFVPGHVVNLGGSTGEVFVPGQVMETDEGPKFIPGNVHRCRRAGPLFVPGQLREGEFIPGKIIETEDGLRFLSPKMVGREEQFTYEVQSFDLHPIELDLVKYQYRSPVPSPVFQGQDIAESLNLMQLAAKGYQAKILPQVEPRRPPPKSKRQIYEHVRVTFLDCIDIAEKARDASPHKSLGKECLTQEAKRMQRVLADDLNNPLPLTDVAAFLRKCLSLASPTEDIGHWIDGLFGQNHHGIFRPLEPMQERKLSRKVSLQKTLADMVREVDDELLVARRRDIVLENLVRVVRKDAPLRSHVDDYRERWQERVSGILLTAGKIVLNDVFTTVAYGDECCVKEVLDDVKEKVHNLAADNQTVDILEASICRYVQKKMANRLDDLLSYGDANSAPNRDGLTQDLLISQAVGFALLEDEPIVAKCLKQCLATPPLVGLLPLYRNGMDMLRTVLNMHSISEGDERRQSLLGNLARCPSVLCDSGCWVKLVSGAMVITQHVHHKQRRLRNAGSIPDEVLSLLAQAQSPEVDEVFHEVILDASCHVLGGGVDLPVMVVKSQFEGIIPRDAARDVINGTVRYLLVNESGVKLMSVGEVVSERSDQTSGDRSDVAPREEMSSPSAAEVPADSAIETPAFSPHGAEFPAVCSTKTPADLSTEPTGDLFTTTPINASNGQPAESSIEAVSDASTEVPAIACTEEAPVDSLRKRSSTAPYIDVEVTEKELRLDRPPIQADNDHEKEKGSIEADGGKEST